MSWDIYSKLLLKECPQDFVTYFVPGAQYVQMREAQLQTRDDGPFEAREMRGDGMIEAQEDGKHFLIDIEWQSSEDTGMDERLLGYSYEATRLHKLSVLPCVIYTQPVARAPQAPLIRTLPLGRPLLWFDYESVEVASQSVEQLRRLDLDGFQPLMLLCRDGANYDVLEEVLTRLEQHKRKELISLTRFFAGKVFVSKADQERLERRFAMLRDLLEDSWTFRQTRDEGIAQGLEEGRVNGLRQGVEAMVLARFPRLFVQIKGQLASLADPAVLQKILIVVGTAQTDDEVKQSLSALLS